MHQPIGSFSEDRRDALAVREMVMQTFCDLLRSTNLPPMTILEYASAAVGSVYREAADAHIWPSACPCGWEPDELADIRAFQRALVREAASTSHSRLALTPAMGTA